MKFKVASQIAFATFLCIGTVHLIQDKGWNTWWMIVPIVAAMAVLND